MVSRGDEFITETPFYLPGSPCSREHCSRGAIGLKLQSRLLPQHMTFNLKTLGRGKTVRVFPTIDSSYLKFGERIGSTILVVPLRRLYDMMMCKPEE